MVGYSTTAKSVARFWPAPWAGYALANFKTILLFAFLQTMDIVTTGYGLSHGITYEANPLAASVLVNGLGVMLASKALVVATVAMFVVRMSVRFPRLWLALWVGNIFYLLVLGINLWSLLP